MPKRDSPARPFPDRFLPPIRDLNNLDPGNIHSIGGDEQLYLTPDQRSDMIPFLNGQTSKPQKQNSAESPG